MLNWGQLFEPVFTFGGFFQDVVNESKDFLQVCVWDKRPKMNLIVAAINERSPGRCWWGHRVVWPFDSDSSKCADVSWTCKKSGKSEWVDGWSSWWCWDEAWEYTVQTPLSISLLTFKRYTAYLRITCSECQWPTVQLGKIQKGFDQYPFCVSHVESSSKTVTRQFFRGWEMRQGDRADPDLSG